MQQKPELLHNQLRFDLAQPYSINKLSVRHKKPSPIIIERGNQYSPDAEDEQVANFNVINGEKLKQAQFLAQRELKRQKEEKLMEAIKTSERPQVNNKPNKKKYINKQPFKSSPTRVIHHLPVSGDSPPVRDSHRWNQTKSVKTNSSALAAAKRNLNQKFRSPSSSPLRQSPARKGTSAPTTTRSCILKEKLESEEVSYSMPDLHRLAIDQLIRVQQGEYIPELSTAGKRPTKIKQRKSQSGAKRKVNNANSTSEVRFVRPSVRAEAARLIRERIYRQQLHHPLPTPQRMPYTPDKSTRSQLSSYQDTEKKPLPDAEEFIRRVNDARKEQELVNKYQADPKKLVEAIEREARCRLEPLIQQAEHLSKTMLTTVRASQHQQPAIVTPQYNTGHDSSEDVSVTDLYQHPVSRFSSEPATASVSGTLMNADALPVEHSGNQQSTLSTDDMIELRDMLYRLNEMEKEHVNIRQRWQSVADSYNDIGLVSLDDPQPDTEEIGSAHLTEEIPKPMMITKSHAHSKDNYYRSLSPTTNTTRPSDIRHTEKDEHKFSENHTEGQHRLSTLPERTIKSIEDGRKRYQRHLENICHSTSKGFNPWSFVQQTADEIVQKYLDDVVNEIFDMTEELTQELHSDEFISTAHQPATPPTAVADES